MYVWYQSNYTDDNSNVNVRESGKKNYSIHYNYNTPFFIEVLHSTK